MSFVSSKNKTVMIFLDYDYDISRLMKKSFISVVIPTWRKSRVLKRCLDSLLDQDYPSSRFEIIIVSQKKIKPQSKRVKSVLIPKNVNHAESRNVGVKKAKGEIIAFCDDDCILPKNWLSAASNCFVQKKADLIGGPVVPPREASFAHRIGGYLSGSRFAVGFAAPRHRTLFPEQEANEFDLILANTFIKKSVFEKFGGFNREQVPCEENFLYAKLKANNCRLFYSPQITCLHPAKPVIFPWAQKIFFYATGRGLMTARAPETFHFQYLVPTFFLLTSVFLLLLFPLSPPTRSLLLVLFSVYLFLSLINAIYIFLKFEKNPLIFIVGPVTTLVIHFSYGLGFLNGFLRYLIGKKDPIKMSSNKI